jgi:molecular chaperone DnaJ
LGGNEDIDIPAGTQSGQIFRFRGKGVAQLRGSRRGDQLVTIDVRIPGKLSTEQKDLLEQLSQILPDVEQEEGEGIFSKFKNAFGA